MNDRQIDRLLWQLEKTCRRDLALLKHFRLDYFETSYLEELLVIWQTEQQQLKHWQRLLLQAAIFSPIWLLVGLSIATWSSAVWGNYLAVLFPVSVFAYLSGSLFLYHRYGSLKSHHHLGKIIRVELAKRKSAKIH